MKSESSFTIFLTCCLGVVVASTSSAQPTALQWNFDSVQTLTTEVIERDTVVTIRGQASRSRSKITSEVSRTGRTDDVGNISLNSRIGRILLEFELPNGEKKTIDSFNADVKPKGPDAFVVENIRNLCATNITYTLSPTGDLKGVFVPPILEVNPGNISWSSKRLNETTTQQQFKQYLDLIQPGETWTLKEIHPLGEAQEAQIHLTFQCRLQSKPDAGKIADISVECTDVSLEMAKGETGIKESLSETPLPVPLRSEPVKGFVKFDIENGQVTEFDKSANFGGEIEFLSAAKFPIKAQIACRWHHRAQTKVVQPPKKVSAPAAPIEPAAPAKVDPKR